MKNAFAFSLLVVGGLACKDPVHVYECTIEIASGCWTRLGLENEWIAEIAVTPWGLFVGTADHGIFRLEPDGRWKALGPKTWHNRLVPRALLYVPSRPPRLLVGLDFRHDSNDTTRAAVYASLDRGKSWVPHDGGLAARSRFPHRVFVHDLEVDPRDPRRVFLSNIHGVLRSLDSGQTWDFVLGDFNILSNGFVDVLIDRNAAGRLWVAGEGLLFNPVVSLSHDWGETWDGGAPLCEGRVFETPVYALAVAPTAPDRVFLGVELGLMQSESGGVPGSWNCVTGPRGAVVGFAELDAVLYAATVQGGELAALGWYRTTNGGASWDSLAVPHDALGATVTAVDSARGWLLIGTRAGLWAVTPQQ